MSIEEAEEWKKRGNEQYMKGNFEGAIASLDKALEIKPGYHVVWYSRGVTLGNLGRFEDARSSVECDRSESRSAKNGAKID